MSTSRNLGALLGLLVGLCCAPAFAQPANDNCAAAAPISEGVGIPFDTTGATNESPLPPGACGTAAPDVWYSFVASCTGTGAVETTSYPAGGVNQDTILQVLDGTCAGANLGCDDDEGPLFMSAVSFPVVAGNSYLIRVSGWSGTTGSGTFDLTCYAPPSNDDCLAAITVAPFVSMPFSTAGGTNTAPALTCAGARDVWYEFTPATTGLHGISLTGLTMEVGELTGTFVRPSVYSGACGALTQVACITTHSGTATLTAGTSYRIRVGMVSTTTDVRAAGLLTVLPSAPEICTDGLDNDLDGLTDCFDSVDCGALPACAPPANNDCAAAIPIVANTPVPWTTLYATSTTPALTCRGSYDVWFEYTASYTGLTQINLSGVTNAGSPGTGTDTNHSVYINSVPGSCPTNADQVACIDPFTGSATLTSGVSYLIRIGAWSTTAVVQFNGTLTVVTPVPEICTDGIDNDLDGAIDCNDAADCCGTGACPPLPPNDLCSLATVVGLGSPAASGNLSCGTNTPADSTAACGASATNRDVWFSFTAPWPGSFTFSTCGTHDAPGLNLGMDTVIGTYTACGTAQVACNDDAAVGGCALDSGVLRDSRLDATMVAGETLLVRVTYFSTAIDDGNYVFNVTGVPSIEIDCANGIDDDVDTLLDCADPDCLGSPVCPPPNDNCAAAFLVNEGSFAFTNLNATLDGPTAADANMSLDVWFCYTATASGNATIETCNGLGALNDDVMIVYDGCVCPPTTVVASDDDSCGPIGFNSTVTFAVTAGESFLIQLGSWNGSPVGDGILDISVTAPPPTCATAFGMLTQSTDPVTITPGSVACGAAGNSVENSYWRSFAVGGSIIVTCVDFGVEASTAAGATQPMDVRLYSDPTPGGPAPMADLVLLGSVTIGLPPLAGSIVAADFGPGGVAVAAGTTLVVELHSLGAGADSFYLGSNAAGQSAPTYISAAACGLAEPTDLAAIGFPNMHGIINVHYDVGFNDDCADAIAVGEGSFSYDNTAATLDGPTTCDANMTGDLWYVYTPSSVGTATIGTCAPSGTLDDTTLIVYDAALGCPIAGSPCLASDDDSCGPSGFNSSVTIAVTPGNSYLVQVGGWNGSTGTGTLDITLAAGVANDECANAIPLGEGLHPISNVGATNSASTLCDANMSADIWYIFTAPAAGDLTVSTCPTTGTLDDTTLIVYDAALGCPVAGSPCIASDDDTCGPILFNSIVNLPVTAGQGIYIQVGGWNGTTGDGTLEIAFAVPGDDCADAFLVNEGSFLFDNTGASLDGPTTCDVDMTGDLWFCYTATMTGDATIETCNTTGTLDDTTLIVYDGCACPPAGPAIACDDDSCGPVGFNSTVTIPVIAGNSYQIQVGGWDGTEGNGTLDISVVLPCVAPTPSFGAGPLLTGIAPLNVVFNNTSNDGGDPATTYDWLFGDGGSAVGVTNPSYTYTGCGTYDVTLTANGCTTSVSTTTVGLVTVYSMGDFNGDCAVDIGDAIYGFDYLFSGGPPAVCAAAADVNGDGVLDLGDVVTLLTYLFSGGAAPVPGGPGC